MTTPLSTDNNSNSSEGVQPCKVPRTAVEAVRQLLAERRHRGFRALDGDAQRRASFTAEDTSLVSPTSVETIKESKQPRRSYDATQTLQIVNEVMWQGGRRDTNATTTTTNVTMPNPESISPHSRRPSQYAQRPPTHRTNNSKRPSLVYTMPEPEYYAGFLGDVLQPRSERRMSAASRSTSCLRPPLHPLQVNDDCGEKNSYCSRSRGTSVGSRNQAHCARSSEGVNERMRLYVADDEPPKARRLSSVLDPLAQRVERPESKYDAELAAAMVSTLADMRQAGQNTALTPPSQLELEMLNTNRDGTHASLMALQQQGSGVLEAYNFPTSVSLDGRESQHCNTCNGSQSLPQRRMSEYTNATSLTTSTAQSQAQRRPVMPLPRPSSSSMASSSLRCSSASRTTRLTSSLGSREPQLSSDQLTEAFYVRPRGVEMARSAYLHFVQQAMPGHKSPSRRTRMASSASRSTSSAAQGRRSTGSLVKSDKNINSRPVVLLSEAERAAAMPSEMTHSASDLTQRVVRALLEQHNPATR